MRECLLCKGSKTHSVDSLSGRELRALWLEVGSSLDEVALGQIDADTRVHLWCCDQCGFRFFDPELAGNETFYRQVMNADYFASERPEFVRTIDWARRNKLKNVLDVGCGSGSFLDLARDHGLTTHGLELNKAAAKEARRKSHIVFNELLHELDPSHFPERYDLITLFQVLEHVPDPVGMLHDAAGLLTPHGYISVAVPNARGLPKLAWLQPQQWPPHHVSHWRKQDFATVAKAAGLGLVKVESDTLFGRDLEQMWLLQRRLATATGRRAGTPPTVIKTFCFLYRKLGMKFFFPRIGSSIQAYFAPKPNLVAETDQPARSIASTALNPELIPPMSRNVRLRRFFSAVASGYVLLFANTIYVLASVPLALHYLTKREFGLWALTMQLTGYLQLIDLGMSSSISRHLIDHKDDRRSGAYGSMVQTGFLVLAIQGLIVLSAAFLFINVGTGLLRIDTDLQQTFKLVMIIQCAIVAADFPARLVFHMLVAHQRTDITNYSQTGMFLITYASLWYFFAHGSQVFSLAWANLIGWAGNIAVGLIAATRLRIIPATGTWGKASWNKFRELFSYGKDVFWIALGAQMINASQSIVITRTLGLDTAGIWSVCTRTLTLANQLVWRPFDFSYPMLSEMVVRSERERLLGRFKGLVVVSMSLAVLAAAMLAICNQPFIYIWTHGRVAWGIENDVLLAMWLIVLALVHSHCGLVLITKRIGFMRYIYFIEGAVFLAVGTYAAHRFGISGLITTSLVCSIAFTGSYGIYRTVHEFGVSPKEVLGRWLAPASQLLAATTIVGLPLYWSTRTLPPWLQLLLCGGTIGVIGSVMFVWRGLGQELSRELRERAPAPVSRILAKIVPGPVSSQPTETAYD